MIPASTSMHVHIEDKSLNEFKQNLNIIYSHGINHICYHESMHVIIAHINEILCHWFMSLVIKSCSFFEYAN